MGGFGLADTDDGDGAWILPPRVLAPGGYLVVFASGDDIAGPEGPLHADFRLDADGEPLTLVDPDGAVIQRFAAAPRAADVAYGLPATALIEAGASARYRAPEGPNGWTGPDFDDGGWAEGPTGMGRDPGGPPSALEPWADALTSHWSFDTTRLDDDGSTVVLDARPGSPRHVRLERAARLVDGRFGQASTGGGCA